MNLLKTSSANAPVNVLNLQLPPLPPLAKAVDEDLESQARASLSLFGFGARDAVTWSVVASSSSSESNGSANTNINMSPGMSTTASGATNNSGGVMLMERVCPIGTNTFLWNTMNLGESNAGIDPSALDGGLNSNGNGGMNPGEDASGDPEWDPLGYGHIFASKILQQYLVKCVAVFPASVEEVIDLIIRSDRDDMETTMHHLVGIKSNASGVIYRRRKSHKKRSQPTQRANNSTRRQNSTQSSTTAANSTNAIRQRAPAPSHSSTIDCDASDSSSSSESDVEVVSVSDALDSENRSFSELSRQSSTMSTKSKSNGQSTAEMSSNGSRSIAHSYVSMSSTSSVTSASTTTSSYMDEYHASLMHGGGIHQGNLSLKWVVGEKTGRMFTQRANYCLLDYECILVNDWEEGADGRPMYVRALQSCYLAQCQPWIDELGVRPADLQPTGIMVRESKHRPGFVEVQFVASILEKMQLPMTSRRTKLRALCVKIAKLEEVITSRRLSQSLLTHQPNWVNNRERIGCNCCDAVFSLTRRRHHCRLCGEVCCSDCCPKKDVALPEVGTTSVRVCTQCVQKRRYSGESIESSSVSSMSLLVPNVLSPTGSKASSSASASPYVGSSPPMQHTLQHYSVVLQPSLSSSSSPPLEHYLSSSGGAATSFGSSYERKPSLASSMFQKFKSSSLGAS
ncbi:Zinc finger fyve domain-containing protein 9, partial [Globisporangium splendens]